MRGGRAAHRRCLNGKPGYINFLDALNALAAGERAEARPPACPPPRPSSTSAPPARRVGLPLADALKKMYFVGGPGAFPARLRLCARPRRGPHVLLRRLDRPVRRVRRGHGEASSSTRCRTASSPRAIPPEALEILKTQAQGQLQHRRRSTQPTSPRPWSTRMCSASPLSRGATS